MIDAIIYDHLRTPRGRGRSDGSLHEITPVQLAAEDLRGQRETITFRSASAPTSSAC